MIYLWTTTSVTERRCWVINTLSSYQEIPDFDVRLLILTGGINMFFIHCSECWDNTVPLNGLLPLQSSFTFWHCRPQCVELNNTIKHTHSEYSDRVKNLVTESCVMYRRRVLLSKALLCTRPSIICCLDLRAMSLFWRAKQFNFDRSWDFKSEEGTLGATFDDDQKWWH
jgi:hypothetical protein